MELGRDELRFSPPSFSLFLLRFPLSIFLVFLFSSSFSLFFFVFLFLLCFPFFFFVFLFLRFPFSSLSFSSFSLFLLSL